MFAAAPAYARTGRATGFETNFVQRFTVFMDHSIKVLETRLLLLHRGEWQRDLACARQFLQLYIPSTTAKGSNSEGRSLANK